MSAPRSLMNNVNLSESEVGDVGADNGDNVDVGGEFGDNEGEADDRTAPPLCS